MCNIAHFKVIKTSNFSLKTNNYSLIGKFYGTPNNLSVLVHQLHKIIVK